MFNILLFRLQGTLFSFRGQDDLGTGLLFRLTIPNVFAEQVMKRVEVYQFGRVFPCS